MSTSWFLNAHMPPHHSLSLQKLNYDVEKHKEMVSNTHKGSIWPQTIHPQNDLRNSILYHLSGQIALILEFQDSRCGVGCLFKSMGVNTQRNHKNIECLWSIKYQTWIALILLSFTMINRTIQAIRRLLCHAALLRGLSFLSMPFI